jgi:anhydro-N-acetylmuramic acid kinase
MHGLLAFDTGPGNRLVDGALRHFSGSQQHYNAGGQMAAQGCVHQELLAMLLAHPFIAQSLPKATGRTAFTAASILDNYHRFIWPRWTITEVIICGGGVDNAKLMRLRRDGLTPCAVTPPHTYSYPNAALEAILFAWLAHATVHGRPGNVPDATGTRQVVVLGKIVPA